MKCHKSDINVQVINVNINIKLEHIVDGHLLANFMTTSKN